MVSRSVTPVIERRRRYFLRALWILPLVIASGTLCLAFWLYGGVCLLGGPEGKLGDPVGVGIGTVLCLVGYGFYRVSRFLFSVLARH
jgi:hypothetical protein